MITSRYSIFALETALVYIALGQFSSCPVLVIFLDEAEEAAASEAEEVTCLMVRMVRPGLMIAELAHY